MDFVDKRGPSSKAEAMVKTGPRTAAKVGK